MFYECEIVINKPREKVVELFDNHENLKKWQPSLEIAEAFGTIEPGLPGSKTRLIYKNKGKKLEIIEAVVLKNPPEEFSVTYQSSDSRNMVSNIFLEEGKNKTRWITKNNFKFTGIMTFTSLFMKKAFIAETIKYMDNFKKYAEKA